MCLFQFAGSVSELVSKHACNHWILVQQASGRNAETLVTLRWEDVHRDGTFEQLRRSSERTENIKQGCPH